MALVSDMAEIASGPGEVASEVKPVQPSQPVQPKAIGTVPDELAQLQERLRRAEQAGIEQTLAHRRQSEFAEQQIAGLARELSALAGKQADELRIWRRNLYLWCGAILAVSVVWVSLYRARPSLPVAAKPAASTPISPSVTVPHPGVRLTPPHPAGDTAAKEALDRLDRVLALVPTPELDRVLRAANEWLIASGTPPCTVHLAEGKTSLLVTADRKADMPLAAALARCAEAVEHVVE